MRYRHAPGTPGPFGWSVTVCDASNTREIWHGTAEDEKEAQALATEARGHSQSLKIWIKPPAGPVRSWD